MSCSRAKDIRLNRISKRRSKRVLMVAKFCIELMKSALAQIIIPLIKATEEIPPALRNGRLSAELSRLREASKPKLQVFNDKVVSRTPTFCPGPTRQCRSGE